ncbi:glycosyl transferase [Rubellimicrobium rubrum]|nr:glycosyl transferase [Rubellimicrobium rubrum]
MSDRRPVRHLVRLAALLLGPGRAHRGDLWPGLAIDRLSGRVRWRGRDLLTLSRFADIVPPGMARIAIVGSGPSLARQHPERLESGATILLNGAASLAARLPPLAVAVEDERFVMRHAPMLASLPREVPLMLSAAAMRALAEHNADLLRGRRVALIDNLRRPLGAARRDLDDPALDGILARGANGAALSRDPDRGVIITGTVAFTALQVALAAGPAAILLAGIDLGNADAQPRFYEEAGKAAPSGLVKGMPRILAGFALAREVAGREGVRLSCASPVSALLGLGYDRDGVLD